MKKLLTFLLSFITILGTSACTQFLGGLEKLSKSGDSSSFVSDSSKIELLACEEYGHSLDREMAFLFTHGLLHLLGYDHMNEEDEKEMFKIQDEIMDLLNL